MVLLLPFTEESALAQLRSMNAPISDASNSAIRTSELAIMKCPSDAYNQDSYERGSSMGLKGNFYARGNYAIVFGPDANCISGSVTPDGPCVQGFIATGSDLTKDNSQVWGSGVAGVNKSFRFRDITDGLSNTIALEEVRAGLSSLDPRGVWALGQAGASVTVRNGRLSDAGSPNPGASGSDELIDCAALMKTIGRPGLMANSMPCAVSQANVQAGSRSMHPSGVHVLFADGSTRFIDDGIDENVWHSCQTRNGAEKVSITND
jgi:prepilin-type processing-associated H-X9-DG protein